MTQEDYGHWLYPGQFSPEDWFGFIYRIIDLDTDREYIGKKQFWSTTRKPVKGKTRRKVVVKSSDWKLYTSSSKHVNAAIGERGKDRFVFLIETLYKSKAALHYGEVEAQINEDVLRAKLPSGERKFYNAMVANMKFIPPAELPEETKMKIRKSLAIHWQNTDNHYFNTMTDEEKAQWNIKYRIGDNNSTRRGKSTEAIELWIDQNCRGDANPMYGMKGPLHPRWGSILSAEQKKNLSEKMKGKMVGEKNPRFGRSPFENFTDERLAEHKKNLSLKMSGENNPMYGKPSYEGKSAQDIATWKENISKATKGKPKSELTKERMRKPKGPQPVRVCPHCGTEGRGGNMLRYHFDRCKKILDT